MDIRVFVGATTAVLIAGAVVACTSDPGTDAAGRAGSGVAGAPSATAETGGDDAVRRRAGRAEGSIVYGDLNGPEKASEVGAPFDPCTTPTWADLPAEVRPTDGKPHSPTMQTPGDKDLFAVGCLFDNSGKIIISAGDAPARQDGGRFQVQVVWGTELDADPAHHQGSTGTSWNGKPGLIEALPEDPTFGKQCIGLVALSTGVAGALVSNSQFPAVDPCTVINAALTAITAKTPR
ncbi:hypothetical protein UO65_0133 [Actinokineospora spheciospongiae]|uniref:DUF3558 domain-containing protein n=1 Tax=Actinokineospora spheciospongiae TaxID=909613 RepID=W7J678_9PSEU|nr:DUF3558 domain-containing protein [Actinokineospora spheciospongiae]EWC64526.1 hypothetical protein UO65_0133 [Actinokineospora spheciospongiae]